MPDTIQDAENLARSYRGATGRRLIVPPSMIETCKRLGMNTADLEPTRPMPMLDRSPYVRAR